MNWKTFLSSWREVLVGVLVFFFVAFVLASLGNKDIAENPALSLLVSGIASLAMGALKFVAACAAAWFGLSVTFPEANKAITEASFDVWWKTQTTHFQCITSLVAVAVLFIVAALCFA